MAGKIKEQIPHFTIRARLYAGGDIAIGPGKADLLDAIEREGSISAAGRALGLSYRRAWLLVETMNRSFQEPLVVSSRGGEHGGGATVTAFGRQILDDYRALQKDLETAAAPYFDRMARQLNTGLDEKI